MIHLQEDQAQGQILPLEEQGSDVLEGGEGDDVISLGLGINQVNGGEGTDTVLWSGEVWT